MGVKRRDFLKLTAAGGAALLPGAAAASDPPMTDFSKAYGVLVDTVVCIGCRKCEWACNKEHGLTNEPLSAYEDRSVFKQHRRPHDDAFTVVNAFENPIEPGKEYTMKVQCMHCNEPACASACIVGALKKEETGPVSYDAWKCIGCRYCMVACPFQIPAYEYDNALDPEVRKCTFCNETRLAKGERPACVSICPNEALTFGRRDQLLEVAHARISAAPKLYNPKVYGRDEVGGTSWMYLAPCSFKETELPQLGTEPAPKLTESIQHGIFKSFVPPLMLAGLLGLVMHSLRTRHDKPVDQEEQHHDHA